MITPTHKVAAYTSICEEDACWIDQYLAEVETLDTPFAIHLDRCSEATSRRLVNHRLCIGYSANLDPGREFKETDKQDILDLIVECNRFDWALAWDVDETYEFHAPTKLCLLEQFDCDFIDTPFRHLWNDKNHIRVDSHFGEGHRVKFLNLRSGITWKFKSAVTNGPKATGRKRKARKGWFNFVCLHHGMMTQEMRLFHKERWDRIYTKACGKNPYGFWNFACDESIEPVLIEHSY